jgi:hypothetical protein
VYDDSQADGTHALGRATAAFIPLSITSLVQPHARKQRHVANNEPPLDAICDVKTAGRRAQHKQGAGMCSHVCMQCTVEKRRRDKITDTIMAMAQYLPDSQTAAGKSRTALQQTSAQISKVPRSNA